ncbi:MAG: helix-turn-helix domain-containing protein [Pseudobdellovibrionaceae bacterium]
MARTMVVLVGDDRDQCEKLKTMSQGMGCNVQVFTPQEWAKNLNDPNARARLMGEVPALSVGMNPITEGAKILQFPQPSMSSEDHKVRTINELESIAIENAIHEFGGNLTEAAKALGIGRATLYRKVKQYNIDPSSARKKRAA